MDLNARGARFNTFVDGAGRLLGYRTRRGLFAKYLIGLMSSLLRKTAEGVATLFSDQTSAQAMHQSVQQFLADSTWEDAPIRKYVSEYALESLAAEEPVVVLDRPRPVVRELLGKDLFVRQRGSAFLHARSV